jgi:2-methylcitrate dehydratase PrpD
VDHVQRTFRSYPRSFPGWVRIETRAGEVLEAELEDQRGGPENPMAVDEVRAKFRANAALALGDARVLELERAVLSLDDEADLRCLAALRG